MIRPTHGVSCSPAYGSIPAGTLVHVPEGVYFRDDHKLQQIHDDTLGLIISDKFDQCYLAETHRGWAKTYDVILSNGIITRIADEWFSIIGTLGDNRG